MDIVFSNDMWNHTSFPRETRSSTTICPVVRRCTLNPDSETKTRINHVTIGNAEFSINKINAIKPVLLIHSFFVRMSNFQAEAELSQFLLFCDLSLKHS